MRKVEIWERGHDVSMEDLEREIEGRNSRILEHSPDIYERIGTIPTQADLPTIWGAGWSPEKSLSFPRELDASKAKSDLLAFIAERHDGHLETVTKAWDSVCNNVSYDGGQFHEFSDRLIKEIGEILSERIFEDSLVEGFIPVLRCLENSLTFGCIALTVISSCNQ